MSTTVEAALVARLTGDAGVTALVGSRVYPQVVPQDAAMPALAYQRISETPEYSHTGFSSLSRTRFQITIEADTMASVKAVAQAVRIALRGVTWSFGAVDVFASFIESSTDGYSDMRVAPVERIDVVLMHNGE